MKIGIAIAAALALAVVAFLGLRSVLDDGGIEEHASGAASAVEGDGAELEQRLEDAGFEAEGEEHFGGGDWSLDAAAPDPDEPSGSASTHTIDATGTATLVLPGAAGEAGREILLWGDSGEERELPVSYAIELTEDEDGWEREAVAFEDPYPRPPEPEDAELDGLLGTARDTAESALSLLGPGFYEQPDVYATSTDASKDEWLDARADNDLSYPPYLVEVPQSDLITGPVDRALVIATGCEYDTAEAELGVVRPAAGAPDAHPAGHVQVAEFLGVASLRPSAISCRRGKPPAGPLEVGFGIQLARSRLDADSRWAVTRLMLEFDGAAPRDVYSVAEETTGDTRDATEFAEDLTESAE